MPSREYASITDLPPLKWANPGETMPQVRIRRRERERLNHTSANFLQ